MVSTTKVSQINQINATTPPQASPPDLTIQQEAYLLHMNHMKDLLDKMQSETAKFKERREKIEFLHKVIFSISNAMKEGDSLDISKNSDLQNKFKICANLGIEISADKTKYSFTECKRLMDNLNNNVDDLKMNEHEHTRLIDDLYKKSEQSLMIAKDTKDSIDKAIRVAISGIKGG